MTPTIERQEFSPVLALVRSIPSDFTVTLLKSDPEDKFQLCRHQARVLMTWNGLQQLQLNNQLETQNATIVNLTNQLKMQNATIGNLTNQLKMQSATIGNLTNQLMTQNATLEDRIFGKISGLALTCMHNAHILTVSSAFTVATKY